jgi:hypothetical protein
MLSFTDCGQPRPYYLHLEYSFCLAGPSTTFLRKVHQADSGSREDIPSVLRLRHNSLNPFNSGIKYLRATLPAENLIFKGFTARRLYMLFGVKGLMSAQ